MAGISEIPASPSYPSASPSDFSSCEFCQFLWHRLSNKAHSGDWVTYPSTTCPVHEPLVPASEFPLDAVITPCIVGGGAFNRGVIFRTFGPGVYPRRHHNCWALERKDHVLGHPGTARILDPDWADLSRLKDWKRTCLESHGTKCQNPLKIWHMRPKWLIDIKNRCLVRGQVPGNYMALSYSYGRHRGMDIDAGTLEDLQQPQALDAPGIAERLPPIIHHAMFLTSFLGENYLWIDELCIPHHDDEARTQQLEMMGAIYANAIITIISADGDACDGIRGMKGVSERRELRQVVVPFGKERLILRNTETDDMYCGLPYYDRGWTYQEYMLSQRRILINRNELHWECSCSVWHEELVLGVEPDKLVDLRPQSLFSRLPELASLDRIINEYNKRHLRYGEDALPGISGIFAVLSRTFEGGFLYGIPEMFFDLYLGWAPSDNMERRVSSGRTFESHQSVPSLPSWSWVSWRGPFTIFDSFYKEAMCCTRWSATTEMIPITCWYTERSPQSPASERRRIRSTWFESRERNKDPSTPLPPGWRRHKTPLEHSSDPTVYPEGCGEYLFTYDSGTLNRKRTQWLYPFPVPRIDETTPPFTPEQTAYLFCKTTGLTLWARVSDSELLDLLDGNGNNVSMVEVDDMGVLDQFRSYTSLKGRPVDVVAISKVRNYLPSIGEVRSGHENSYVVLWVEWRDGVAYRLGRGEIGADDWERLDPQKVSLVLG